MCSKRHLRCPHCGFLDTIKRSKRAGYSRYSCKSCGSYFTDRRASVSRKNKEVWFREWIVGKRTFSQLVCDSPYSERTLKRYFYEMLPAARCGIFSAASESIYLSTEPIFLTKFVWYSIVMQTFA